MTQTFPQKGDIFVDRYRIESVLGTGGFARVYLATQLDLDRQVAIKVLAPRDDAAQDEERRAHVARRFRREAKLVSKLHDPHTIVMHDYGHTADGLLFMVLEYVDGETLSDLVNREGAIPPHRVAKVLAQALSSLEEAHALGVLHRDIKPANIMVFEHIGRHDQVKVLDFGIAKSVEKVESHSAELTNEGVLVGTPRYMSPEQIMGDELTGASDIYSLGLIAYEMLVGAKAVSADSSMKIIARHLDTNPIELPPMPSTPPGLRAIVDRMTEKQVAARYQTAREILDDLEHWSSDAIPSATSSGSYNARSFAGPPTVMAPLRPIQSVDVSSSVGRSVPEPSEEYTVDALPPKRGRELVLIVTAVTTLLGLAGVGWAALSSDGPPAVAVGADAGTLGSPSTNGAIAEVETDAGSPDSALAAASDGEVAVDAGSAAAAEPTPPAPLVEATPPPEPAKQKKPKKKRRRKRAAKNPVPDPSNLRPAGATPPKAKPKRKVMLMTLD